MRVFTRTGDQGQTSLASGNRVRKDHPRLEAYGTVDELNAVVGMLHALYTDQDEQNRLLRIQRRIFIISSTLAVDDPAFLERLPTIMNEDVNELEKAMNTMLDQMPPLKNFILPSGSQVIAMAHVARTVCRRAERALIRIVDEIEFDPMLIQYINRLSDYFFVLSRWAAYQSGTQERVWKPDFRSSGD